MNKKEKTKHSSALKPYSYYKCEMPNFFKYIPLHWHKEIEINYMKRGVAEFIVDDEKFLAEAGDIIIISSESLHSIYPYKNDRLNYDTIVFSMDILDALGNDRASAECLRQIAMGGLRIKSHIGKEQEHYEEMHESVKGIFKCINENSAEYDMLLKSELFRLFFYLYKSNCIYKGEKSNASYSMIIRPVIEYIEENYAENITVEELANLVHLSKSYFMNKFKDTVGTGAVEYICRFRIKKACELLVNSEKNIAEIAFECGYKNLSNFNKQFKTIVGATPIKYRKMHK